ncbi:hypothetical protein, partial [Pantoea sp. ME81]|uniref:hypothetical protein n=1 Tax=Pantoea sp. ME81 TaxID=2743935 RepID=UPI001C710C8A
YLGPVQQVSTQAASSRRRKMLTQQCLMQSTITLYFIGLLLTSLCVMSSAASQRSKGVFTEESNAL